MFIAQTLPQNWFEYVLKGGFFMLPLLICSIVVIFVAVERYLHFRNQLLPSNFLEGVRQFLTVGDVNAAVAHARKFNLPTARVIAKGIERIGRPTYEIQEYMQTVGKAEVASLENRLSWLSTISSVAPVFGFLGTVTGMLNAFQTIASVQRQANPADLAGGIWEALITTVVGLAIGLLATFAYNYLVGKLQKITLQMELISADFADMLQTPAKY